MILVVGDSSNLGSLNYLLKNNMSNFLQNLLIVDGLLWLLNAILAVFTANGMSTKLKDIIWVIALILGVLWLFFGLSLK